MLTSEFFILTKFRIHNYIFVGLRREEEEAGKVVRAACACATRFSFSNHKHTNRFLGN